MTFGQHDILSITKKKFLPPGNVFVAWKNFKWTKCEVDEKTKCEVNKMKKCQVDKMWSWPNVELNKCKVGVMSSRQNVRLTKS